MPVREYEENIRITFEGASAAVPGLVQGLHGLLRAPIRIRLDNIKQAALPALPKQQLPSLPRSHTNGRQIGHRR